MRSRVRSFATSSPGRFSLALEVGQGKAPWGRGWLILPPLSINAPFEGYLKLSKATQEGEKILPGIEIVTSCTEGCALTNCATLTPKASKGHNTLNHFHTFGTQLEPVYTDVADPM